MSPRLHSAGKLLVAARACGNRLGVALLLALAPWCALSAGCGAQSADSPKTNTSATVDGETSSVSIEGNGESPGIDPDLYECLAATGAEVGEGGAGGPQPVCSYLNAEAGCQASELKTSADRECDVDADCVDVPGSVYSTPWSRSWPTAALRTRTARRTFRTSALGTVGLPPCSSRAQTRLRTTKHCKTHRRPAIPERAE